MTTINPIGNALSGTTGTGNFVGANTPTLITPVLGAATATSINFGGSTLSTYAASQTWTPTMTFGVPGDLSVSYAAQIGYYSRIGNIVTAVFLLEFTPTYTTSTGSLVIDGFPFSFSNTFNQLQIAPILFSSVTYPAGCTSLVLSCNNGTATANVSAQGSAATGVLSTLEILTATQYFCYSNVTYLV